MQFKRHFFSGLATIIPLAITWWLIDFLFIQLSSIGLPLVTAVSSQLKDNVPVFAFIYQTSWFDDVLAALLVVAMIYLLGLSASRFFGQRMVSLFESLLDRIPLIKTVYGSAKQLITAMGTKPENVQRVVLIEFPHQGMRTVGLVTRTLVDSVTGRTLAAVYVPTTPNPTSGYLEIVPLEDVISTNWSIDEAMNFIISGGAVAPESIPYSRSATPSHE